jgi:short-subunit dehydrogenase
MERDDCCALLLIIQSRKVGKMSVERIEGSVAVVSGANRGIGRALVDELLKAGAAKVYAGARNPDSLRDLQETWGSRVVPLRLDVTDSRDVESAARFAADATILFNNAGVAGTVGTSVIDPDALALARHEMEVNYFGVLALSSAFAPILARNGGGAVVNLASVASFVNFPLFQTYSASKAAVHSVTQALRAGLSGQGTFVAGVYPGPVDTEMARDVPMDKTSAQEVASAILRFLEEGAEEIFPDPVSQQMGAMFLEDPKGLEQATAAMAAGEQAA